MRKSCPICETANDPTNLRCWSCDSDLGGAPSSDIMNFKDGCRELELEITLGGALGWQDRKWHVFKKSGDSVNYGAGSVFELICSLSPNEKDQRQEGE